MVGGVAAGADIHVGAGQTGTVTGGVSAAGQANIQIVGLANTVVTALGSIVSAIAAQALTGKLAVVASGTRVVAADALRSGQVNVVTLRAYHPAIPEVAGLHRLIAAHLKRIARQDYLELHSRHASVEAEVDKSCENNGQVVVG